MDPISAEFRSQKEFLSACLVLSRPLIPVTLFADIAPNIKITLNYVVSKFLLAPVQPRCLNSRLAILCYYRLCARNLYLNLLEGDFPSDYLALARNFRSIVRSDIRNDILFMFRFWLHGVMILYSHSSLWAVNFPYTLPLETPLKR